MNQKWLTAADPLPPGATARRLIGVCSAADWESDATLAAGRMKERASRRAS